MNTEGRVNPRGRMHTGGRAAPVPVTPSSPPLPAVPTIPHRSTTPVPPSAHPASRAVRVQRSPR
ncbi:hypothetical protein SAMN05216505_104313 [Streptomyces prasinopilosus]|uniref:Uncharacterized protein n=1 Tax=Streptomyces prasinopilosus TaxID=67344 RepID=A0A1G6QZJ2_9ACTN|nr:hypothetical protein SAMN05216505_104313 [Streptomyces prasinopilosus]